MQANKQFRHRLSLFTRCVPLLALIALLLGGCQANPDASGMTGARLTAGATVEYVGRVTDAQTQRGIAGAKITLDFAGAPPIIYTDSEGVFHFTVLSTGPVLTGRVRVEAQGYAIYDRNVDVNPSAPRLEDIRLNTPIVLSTPTPVPTPIAADVLIVEFDARHATQPVEIGRRLQQNLEQQLRAYGLDNVVVKVLDQPVGDNDQAASLAQSTGSRAVIWGWYDDFGISVRMVLADAQMQTQEVPGIDDLPLELGGDAAAQLAFVVRQVLPENVSFLSLFVIGHLFYSNDEYAQGRAAFDAAMANMPENVAFENEAILHFFRARQMEAAGSADYDAIFCEYAAAIERDPTMAEAYNNLAIFMERIGDAYTSSGQSTAVQACLDRAGLNQYANPSSLLDRYALLDQAIALRPEWVTPKYNRVALDWDIGEWPADIEPIQEQMQTFLAADPSLSGAYIVLGMIEADAGNYATAQDHLATALTRIPAAQSASVHAALGQVYLRQGQYVEAQREYRQALALNSDDQGARLGLAAALYRLDDPAGAVEMARSIRMDASNAAYEMGIILQSRVAFDERQMEQASQLLNSLQESKFAMGTEALLHYLAGLLALAAGDTVTAQAELAHWQLVSELEAARPNVEQPLSSGRLTLDEAWLALAERCASTWQWADEEERQDVLINGACLPADLSARITALYDFWQDQLGKRFYDVNFALGAACPFVFTYDRNEGEWMLDTTILYNLVGPQSERVQARPLERFDGRLLIREVEPEQSFVDLLAVIGVAADGSVTTWLPQDAKLRLADDAYLHLEQGDEAVVQFAPAASEHASSLPALLPPSAVSAALAASTTQWWAVAEGYYVPYRGGEGREGAFAAGGEGSVP